jgi:DNA/RNA endonuclease YhcR with UshA esterase domain
MKPDDPNNIQKLSEGHKPAYVLTDAEKFAKGTVDVVVDDTVTTLPYAQLAMSTSIRMENLVVKDVYTTDNEESSSNGAMTLTCEVNGVTVSVRTVVLIDGNGNLVTADAYMGKTIDVRGIVDYFDGTYQIKVFSVNDITIHN